MTGFDWLPVGLVAGFGGGHWYFRALARSLARLNDGTGGGVVRAGLVRLGLASVVALGLAWLGAAALLAGMVGFLAARWWVLRRHGA